METAEYLDAVRDRSVAFLGAARHDLDASVPSCPGWTVTDLVVHMGRVWGWAANIVRTGAAASFPSIPEGIGGAELAGWAEEQSHALLDALRDADPGAECWAFGPPQSALFWFRRQALETAVHAWDVQQAVGQGEPVDPALASDGLDEFLSVVLPARVQGRPDAWSGQSLHLHRTDAEGEWTVRLGPGSTVAIDPVHGEADVTMSGPASSLYLWCLNRLPAAALDVVGDRAVADRWASEITF